MIRHFPKEDIYVIQMELYDDEHATSNKSICKILSVVKIPTSWSRNSSKVHQFTVISLNMFHALLSVIIIKYKESL